jgi:ATP-binding cassette subfamily B protein
MNIKGKITYLQRDVTRILKLIWQADKQTALINIGLQAVQALLPVLSLYFIKALIEALVKGNQHFEAILLLLVEFGLVQFVSALAGQYAGYINTIHQQTLTDHLSEQVLNKAIQVDYEYYENPGYHDTLHLAQQQSLFRATLLLTNFNSVLLNSLSLVFLIGFFFTLHSVFALLFMLLSIPLVVIKWYSGFALLRMEQKFAPLEREAFYLHQTLTGVNYAKEVRVFNFGQRFIHKFNTIRHHIHTEKTKLHAKLTWYSLIAEVAEIAAMIFIFSLLAKSAFDKSITIGVFVIYVQGFQRLQSTSKGFLQSIVQLFQQRIFLKDLFAFFDIEHLKPDTGNKSYQPTGDGLVINKISFTYPQTNRQVLNQVSLACQPGKIIAIVGENGSGKSTLVKLLARLYNVQTGNIQINGQNIGDLLVDDFRRESVFLFQDFEKYFLTISENITLGDDPTNVSAQVVENAAKLSGAHPFIIKLAKGYQTRMGRLFEGSEQISGGQWQKLALARVFYKDRHLIVLDEPTSALDPTAEFELFNNLKHGLKDEMVILITHRLYNLKIADRIYVMENGRIAEEGAFEELIASTGSFKRMYDAQKL